MRSSILIFAMLMLSNFVHSQYFGVFSHYADLGKFDTIDSAYLKCSYKVIYLKDSLKKKEKSEDLQILLIGENISKYYSQYTLDYNNFVVEYLKTHNLYPHSTTKGAWSYEVFKNYPQEKETVTDIASILYGNFTYEEDLPIFQWEILDETQTVLDYICQKATVTFRGRDYIAWFTPEIPISNGPWKFGGLPGLILRLYDTKENFVFECNGLEQLNGKEPIRFYKLEYARLNRKELDKTYRRFHENVGYYLESIGREFHLSGGGILMLPYNPIELE